MVEEGIGRYGPAMTRLLETLCLPPGSTVLLALLAWLAWRRQRRVLGVACLVIGLGTLAVASLPVTAALALSGLEVDPALPDPREPGALAGAQAVVVLGAEVQAHAPEFGGHGVGALSLQRLLYGARLAREADLPLLVTGGVVYPDVPAVAGLMADVAQRDLGRAPRWVDTRARTTWENAERAAELLAAEGITRVALVTHAWHMPRARACFEHEGLEVLAAPMGGHGAPLRGVDPWLPSAPALARTRLALHEWIGRGWYGLRRALDD